MKIKLTILAAVFISTSSFGQVMSYIDNLQTSDSGFTIAEVSLIHRSISNLKDIKDLGTRIIMIPDNLNGQELKIEYYRFITREGTPFEMNGTAYIPVHLYYDNETTDPRKYIYILSIPFPVETELIVSELNPFESAKLMTPNFKDAPKGNTSYEEKKVNVIKIE